MAVSKSETPFLTVTKSFSYRQTRELWSNVYHVDVTPPASSDWQALFDAAWTRESAFLPADCQVESATGHTPGEPPVLVWEYDVPPPGTGGGTGTFVPGGAEHETPGDVAMWVRWGTDLKNSRGKPVYLRNYYHGVYVLGDGDAISSTQQTALQALGTTWMAGITAAGRTYRRTGPNHGSPQNTAHSTFATTRTLKRRGKRKQLPASFEIMGGPSGQDFFKWFMGKVPSLIP